MWMEMIYVTSRPSGLRNRYNYPSSSSLSLCQPDINVTVNLQNHYLKDITTSIIPDHWMIVYHRVP